MTTAAYHGHRDGQEFANDERDEPALIKGTLDLNGITVCYERYEGGNTLDINRAFHRVGTSEHDCYISLELVLTSIGSSIARLVRENLDSAKEVRS